MGGMTAFGLADRGMEGAQSPIARIQLLGKFRLELADGTDATPTELKAQALIAILALSTNGRASREMLATMLWGRVADEQARGSLRHSLSSSR